MRNHFYLYTDLLVSDGSQEETAHEDIVDTKHIDDIMKECGSRLDMQVIQPEFQQHQMLGWSSQPSRWLWDYLFVSG